MLQCAVSVQNGSSLAGAWECNVGFILKAGGSCNAVTHTEVRGQLISHEKRAQESPTHILRSPDLCSKARHTYKLVVNDLV